MQSAFRMATKSCVPKFRSDSDEEVNQEVPSNYAGNQTAQKPIQRAPRSMTDPVWKTPRNPPTPPQISLPTSQASREYNWQGNMTSVREKNSVMYNNPLMADVYFTVGSGNNKQRIAAHKYVLATGSSVFYAMFYGGLADQKDDIELPDVEPVAFQNLLRYL
jgi:BTB/POZ domain-containing protein 3/6